MRDEPRAPKHAYIRHIVFNYHHLACGHLHTAQLLPHLLSLLQRHPVPVLELLSLRLGLLGPLPRSLDLLHDPRPPHIGVLRLLLDLPEPPPYLLVLLRLLVAPLLQRVDLRGQVGELLGRRQSLEQQVLVLRRQGLEVVDQGAVGELKTREGVGVCLGGR